MTKVRIFLTLVRGSGFEGQDPLKVRIFLTLVRGTEFEGQDSSVLGQTHFSDQKRSPESQPIITKTIGIHCVSEHTCFRNSDQKELRFRTSERAKVRIVRPEGPNRTSRGTESDANSDL